MTTPSATPGDPDTDPLVPPLYADLSAVTGRLHATLRRSGRTLAAIVSITFALPMVVVGGLSQLAGFGVFPAPIPLARWPAGVEPSTVVVAIYAALVLAAVLSMYVNAIGWAAGIWAVTQEAATGAPVPVRAALAAGARRGPAMVGWYLLFAIGVGAGMLAFLVPGLYLFLAGSLFSFSIMYEQSGGDTRGRSPAVRSFGLVHRHFRAALSRVFLALLFLLLAMCLVGVLTSALGPAPTGSLDPGALAGLPLLSLLIQAAVQVPVVLLMLVSLLLTYAQLRSREEALSTAALCRAL